MLVIHIANNSKKYPNKFVPPYQNFVENELSGNVEHRFIYLGDSSGIDKSAIILKDNLFSAIRVLLFMMNANIVVFHSLPSKYNMLFLSNIISLFNRVYLVLWGGEIYHRPKAKKLKTKIKYYFENKFLLGVCNYITYISEDVDYIVKNINPKAKQVDLGGFYLGNLIKDNKDNKDNKVNKECFPDNNVINILVGVSASERNNHYELLRIISEQDYKNYALHIPLSYGDFKYAEKLKAYIYGNFPSFRLNILDDFMRLEDYNDFLSNIDVALFGHNNQQGMGNIRQLISNGTIIYCLENSVTYLYLKKLGFEVFTLGEFSLCDSNKHVKSEKNKHLARELFSYSESVVLQKRFYGRN
ncbi:hypothetical protein FKQ60_10145 [Vibrio sp. A11]|uniref:TDP-N-acetylfucosamine:lipid II N-acetylfucosaminyltransferase n=1 Tax=Vibrio sp. A11 TaxID=2591464 RepID=UPI001483CCBA|nr:TDP-N-acetylfucosamine:lipid II N-acetylfucosaminyltransferase [Vibrio sp. A11]NNN61210.1 hypothetical protein [Vibrio sp. A11]